MRETFPDRLPIPLRAADTNDTNTNLIPMIYAMQEMQKNVIVGDCFKQKFFFYWDNSVPYYLGIPETYVAVCKTVLQTNGLKCFITFKENICFFISLDALFR